MIQSMTGRGQGEAKEGGISVVVEVKSVNHRFREFRFRLPGALAKGDLVFKSILGKWFRRGSFEIFCSVDYGQGPSTKVDYVSVGAFLEEFQKNVQAPWAINPTDFLRDEFTQRPQGHEELVSTLAQRALEGACQQLQESRQREGEKLQGFFFQHLASYERGLEVVERGAQRIHEVVLGKLRERLAKSQVEVDESRLMQEVVFYLEKLDISEEIHRMRAHVGKLREIFSQSCEVGREAEFLLQELHRETNTLSSKSSMVEISKEVVKMKVELEKMREQGLNIQ